MARGCHLLALIGIAPTEEVTDREVNFQPRIEHLTAQKQICRGWCPFHLGSSPVPGPVLGVLSRTGRTDHLQPSL